MNRTSIAAITSVLILILIGCGGKSTNAAESPGSEVSKTNVNIDVKPAMKFVTRILQIKDVKKGETIGYGAYKVEKDTKVAILPIGYSNGIGKKRRYVLINGNKYYSIGEIAMNMMAISIDDKVKISDEVVVLGDELTLGKVSDFNNSTLSETLINIGNSNTIVYKED